jgi:hypothetical protein
MPQVEFEPTIPVFERTKTVHALDRGAAVIGCLFNYFVQIMHKLSYNTVSKILFS